MKILIVLMSFVLFACKSAPPTDKKDVLSNLLSIQRNENLAGLLATYGKPATIEKTEESDILKYTYSDVWNSKESFVVFVDSKKARIISSVVMFWKNDDDYSLLRQRYGQYPWIENYVPTSTHPLRELYKVEIPVLGMTFEYDKLAPKIMWIFLESPHK